MQRNFVTFDDNDDDDDDQADEKDNARHAKYAKNVSNTWDVWITELSSEFIKFLIREIWYSKHYSSFASIKN